MTDGDGKFDHNFIEYMLSGPLLDWDSQPFAGGLHVPLPTWSTDAHVLAPHPQDDNVAKPPPYPPPVYVNPSVRDTYTHASSGRAVPTPLAPSHFHESPKRSESSIYEGFTTSDVVYSLEDFDTFTGGPSNVALPSLAPPATANATQHDFGSEVPGIGTASTTISPLDTSLPSTSVAGSSISLYHSGPSAAPHLLSADVHAPSAGPSSSYLAAPAYPIARSYPRDDDTEEHVRAGKRRKVAHTKPATPPLPPQPSDTNIRPQKRAPKRRVSPRADNGVPVTTHDSVAPHPVPHLAVPHPDRAPIVHAPSGTHYLQIPHPSLPRAHSTGSVGQHGMLLADASTAPLPRAHSATGRNPTPLPAPRDIHAQRYMRERGISFWPRARQEREQEFNLHHHAVDGSATGHRAQVGYMGGDATRLDHFASEQPPTPRTIVVPDPPFNPDAARFPPSGAPKPAYNDQPHTAYQAYDIPEPSSAQTEVAGPSSSTSRGRKRKNAPKDTTPGPMPAGKRARRSHLTHERPPSPVQHPLAVPPDSPPFIPDHVPTAPGAGHPSASHPPPPALARSPSSSKGEGPSNRHASPLSDDEPFEELTDTTPAKWERATYVAYQLDTSYWAREFPEASYGRTWLESCQMQMRTHVGFVGDPESLDRVEAGQTQVEVRYLSSETRPMHPHSNRRYVNVKPYFFKRDPLAKQTARARKAMEVLGGDEKFRKNPAAYEPEAYPWFAPFEGSRQHAVFGTKLLVTQYKDSDSRLDLSHEGMCYINTLHRRDEHDLKEWKLRGSDIIRQIRRYCVPEKPVPARVWRDVSMASPEPHDPARFLQELRWITRFYLHCKYPDEYERPAATVE
ncbi:hypothetical protein EVJ58_g662 [Rhodofomes roseus]|uniref:Uncharacterized protein n=1 Tax=Rhodofomes roseus TaxID=34475 RepID=A0A4Y9Z2C8_9APHY|nr:hypothetical protein EVJ58_g662 [Rhodofomes roseus]